MCKYAIYSNLEGFVCIENYLSGYRIGKNPHVENHYCFRGIRQVGKTWLLKEFGRLEYDDVAYFNLDENIDLVSYFETTGDPSRILEQLSFFHGRQIVPGLTLLILDEIQESNSALNSLKYFLEKTPEYHIAATGSYLGIALSGHLSFPVGKVNFMKLHPMSYEEFLIAKNNIYLQV